MGDFYVYCYFRPDGSPCYIGKGRRDRWLAHLRKSTNVHLARIITNAGGEIPHVKLCTGLTSEQAVYYEISWIRALGRGRNGPLVNMTDGGDGVSGLSHSEISRAKMSAAKKGKPGRSHTKESRTKMKQRTFSPEQRAALSEQAKKRRWSAEQRALLSASHIGKQQPREVVEKRAASHRGMKYKKRKAA